MNHPITPATSRQPSLRPVRMRRPSPSTRVGDAERDAACAQLAAHYSAGRLSPAEMDERTSAAVAATTHADLLALLDDLPPLGPGLGPGPGLPLGATMAPRVHSPLTRQVVMALWATLTALAAVCTVLLLMATLGTGYESSTTFLGVLGGAVSASGITFFVTRGGQPPHPSRMMSTASPWAPARQGEHTAYWGSNAE